MQAMGQRGLKRVNALFTWHKISLSIAKLYEHILLTRRPAERNGEAKSEAEKIMRFVRKPFFPERRDVHAPIKWPGLERRSQAQ